MMRKSAFLLPALVLAGCLLLPPSGWAQDKVLLDAPAFTKQKPKPGPPDVRAPAQAWPRLDPGSALCRTEDDLARLSANRRGEAGGPADCRIVSAPTAIEILQRKSPGRTEVRVSGRDSAIGWTDVWLPERPPNPSAAAVR
jgi:hypothetical protein